MPRGDLDGPRWILGVTIQPFHRLETLYPILWLHFWRFAERFSIRIWILKPGVNLLFRFVYSFLSMIIYMLFGGYVSLGQRLLHVESCISDRKWHQERESRSFLPPVSWKHSCAVRSLAQQTRAFAFATLNTLYFYFLTLGAFLIVRRTVSCTISRWIDVGLRCSRVTKEQSVNLVKPRGIGIMLAQQDLMRTTHVLA